MLYNVYRCRQMILEYDMLPAHHQTNKTKPSVICFAICTLEGLKVIKYDGISPMQIPIHYNSLKFSEFVP